MAYRKAIEIYKQPVIDHPDVPDYRNGLADAVGGRAWLLATPPDDRIRNAKQALADAQRACELSGWKAGYHLDTLVAAYAESGDFPKAVEWAKKAIALTEEDEEKADFQQRLKLYRAGKPFRDIPDKEDN